MDSSMKPSTHYKELKTKWLKKHDKAQNNLWGKHRNALNWAKESSKQAVVGSLASLLMLTSPISSLVFQPQAPNENHLQETTLNKKDQFLVALKSILPSEVTELDEDQERNIGEVLTKYYSMPVSAILDSKRLNRSYGYIGKEQHLMRYAGDTIDSHFSSPEEAIFASSGMAPGRGAWGYFISSNSGLTQEDIQREKYYLAVQTFLAPGWSSDPLSLYQFFKFRKMLVVNPENGKAVVAVIGDAGPGVSTGKHLGGSPEVMAHLERVDGAQKGPVLYFFIDDQENKVPLGPIDIQ